MGGGTESAAGQELLTGQWSRPARLWVPGPPPSHQGWARGAPTRWLLLPLTLTHSLTKISLAGGSQPRAARPGKVPSPPVAGTPRTPARGVPPGEGGGAGPRRGASPGTPGRAPGGQSGPPPAAPPSSRGSSLRWWGARPGPAPNAPTACAPARERCPSVSTAPSPRELLRAPAASRSSESPRPRPPDPPGQGRVSPAGRPR